MKNRRQFIHQFSAFSSVLSVSATSISTLSISALLQSCSTIDEQLINDPNDLADTVAIVGGGISGLYAAYQLKKRKIAFRIFESSLRLGGKIHSNNFFEYGAFEFSNADQNLLRLAKELNLKTEKIDSKNWVFKNGTADFMNHLIERISGVLPTEHVRFQNKLMHIEQKKNYFKLNFATAGSDKTYTSTKVLLALPVEKLKNLKGLETEMKSVQIEMIRYTRIVIPVAKISSKMNLIKPTQGSAKRVRYSVQILKNIVHITLSAPENVIEFPLQIEKLNAWMNDNIFNGDLGKINLQPENIFVWSAAQTQDEKIIGSKNRVIVSDGLNRPHHRVETLLSTVNEQIDQLL